MKTRLPALVILATVVVAAAENPVAGTWKLDLTRSTTESCPSGLRPSSTLIVPKEVYTGAAREAIENVPLKSAGAAAEVSLFHISPDGRTLTQTLARKPECKLVYERKETGRK
jgi:hypothetical protein